MTYDLTTLRRAEFPWAAAGESIFLNNASTGPLPVRTLDAIAAFNALRGAPHRLADDIQFATLARSRELIATLIGATTSEIALATNTGFGINLAAHALPMERGDIVLGIDGEFPANIYPWMDAANNRGIEFRLLPSRDLASLEASVIAALDTPRVKVLALSWVAFASGFTFDLERIGAECKARGIFFVVDAIQGLGPRTIDLRRVHVDVLASGAQKWLLSPWGSAFVYVRRELIDRLAPHEVSWMAVRGSDDFTRLTDYDMTWRDDARRFENITLPFQDFAGMNASLELIHSLGLDAVQAHVIALADRIVAWAEARGDVSLVTPRDRKQRSGIVSFSTKDSQASSAVLRAAGVVHSLREGAIRLSPHFYSTPQEVDQALSLIKPAT